MYVPLISVNTTIENLFDLLNLELHLDLKNIKDIQILLIMCLALPVGLQVASRSEGSRILYKAYTCSVWSHF